MILTEFTLSVEKLSLDKKDGSDIIDRVWEVALIGVCEAFSAVAENLRVRRNESRIVHTIVLNSLIQ